MDNKKYINFYREDAIASFSSMIIGLNKKYKKILFAIEDERVLRRKHHLYEGNSRKWIFDRLKEFDIDYTSDIEIFDTHGITQNQIINDKNSFDLKGAEKGHSIAENEGTHHLYHALNAYYQSGFKDASILIIDGCDYPINGTSIAIFKAENDKIELVKSYGTDRSLGLLYGFGCIQCGFTWDEGGKLMGLSSYGKVDYNNYVPFFLVDKYTGEITESHGCFNQRKYVNECPSATIEFDNELINCLQYHYYPDKFIPNISDFNFKKANFAAYIQKLFEDAEFSLLEYMHNTLPSRNLIISGGCGLNCVANGKIIRSKKWDNFFIPTTCNDAGNAIGIAIHKFNIKISKPLIYNRYTYKIPKEYNKIISKLELADKIRKGQIVAWFEGGSEYGPRALCHRSILANPELSYMAYRINEIKNRHYWRPLAPVVLDIYFDEIFSSFNETKLTDLHKVMLATEYISPNWRYKIPAVCACDGSSRPQVLTDIKENHTLYSLMYDHNLPILINTSMNDKGEPMCETPEDAINFCNKNTDVMLVFIKDDKIYTK